MADLDDPRGILYPARLPTFHRLTPPADLRDRIRWFWMPRWNLAPGQTSRQEVLPFPASNLVVAPAGVSLSGPTTGASHRELTGRGWAVGALLRPAGIVALRDLAPDAAEPGALRDAEIAFPAPGLHDAVVAAMHDDGEAAGRIRAADAYAEWARVHLAAPDDTGLLANAMEDLIAEDHEIVRVDQLAARMGLTVRAVQRLARRCFGVPPLAVIRRYRLQEAAQRLREEPSLTVAQVAADLGYTDHAHLAADFRTVLNLAPHAYRRAAGSSRNEEAPDGRDP